MDCINETATNVTRNLTCLFEDNFFEDDTTAAADIATVSGGNFTDGGDTSNLAAAANILLPILLLEFILSTFSNVVLLFLIARSRKSLTTLNVFLLSLGILNLMVSANQVIVFSLILAQGHPFPSEICHAGYAIQTLGSYGVTFFHLAISYNRYHTTLNPIHWESSLRKAWISITVIWVLSCLLAALFFVVHIRGIQGDVHYCFWPNFEMHVEFKVILHVLLHIIVLISIGIAAYYYRKTIKLHDENRKALEREMEMTSDIHIYEKEQNAPEKTTKSLVAVFGIQITAMIIPFSYNIIRALLIAIRSKVTGDQSDPSPTTLLLFFTTLGLFTTAGPFSLLVVSRRFKDNVTGIFRCKCERSTNKVHLVNPHAARASITRRPAASVPKQEQDYSWFLGNDPTYTYRVSQSSLMELAEEEKAMEMRSAEPRAREKVYDRSESIRDFLENTEVKVKVEAVVHHYQ